MVSGPVCSGPRGREGSTRPQRGVCGDTGEVMLVYEALTQRPSFPPCGATQCFPHSASPTYSLVSHTVTLADFSHTFQQGPQGQSCLSAI